MARPVKPEKVAAKRKEILDAAQRLVMTKGYEQMSIRDVLDAIQISSGAFHHYFDSRQALLEAIVEQTRQAAKEMLLPIIHDPHLTAIEKLQGIFDTLDRLRTAQRAEVIKLVRVWYSDSNALIRQKVEEAILQQRAPLFAEIVHQGVREGVFTIAYPDKAGEVILSLLQGMGNTHIRLLLALDQKRDDPRFTEKIVEEIVAVHAAYMEAIERVLGVPSHSLYRADTEIANIWVAAVLESDPP